jgi:hypothetical protein
VVSTVSRVQKHVVASLGLLLLRDLGLVLGLAFGPSPRRAEVAAAFYLAVLYVLAPGIAGQLDAPWLSGLFWPRVTGSSLAALGPLAVEAAAFLGFAWLRWRRAAERFPPPA